MTGRIRSWKKVRIGMEILSAFKKVDMLDLDGHALYGKIHCNKLKPEQWFQLRDYMQRKNWSTP